MLSKNLPFICEVSIPVWFDWEPESISFIKAFTIVSIPVWFDWEDQPADVRGVSFTVSIPVWFDWESIKNIHTRPRFIGFNSSMVRLGVHRSRVFHLLLSVSIPVWFDWEKKFKLNNLEFGRVSIPVWFDWEKLADK